MTFDAIVEALFNVVATIGAVATFVLLALRIAGVIDWPWWAVLSPFTAVIALAILIAVVWICCFVVAVLTGPPSPDWDD